MNNIENLIHVEAQERFEKMNGMDATNDECKANADLALKLVDKAIKMAEFENQAKLNSLKEKELNLQAEANKLKAKELEEAKKGRWLGFAESCIKTVGGTALTFIGAVVITKIERTDIVTGMGPKGMWNNLFRKG